MNETYSNFKLSSRTSKSFNVVVGSCTRDFFALEITEASTVSFLFPFEILKGKVTSVVVSMPEEDKIDAMREQEINKINQEINQ